MRRFRPRMGLPQRPGPRGGQGPGCRSHRTLRAAGVPVLRRVVRWDRLPSRASLRSPWRALGARSSQGRNREVGALPPSTRSPTAAPSDYRVRAPGGVHRGGGPPGGNRGYPPPGWFVPDGARVDPVRPVPFGGRPSVARMRGPVRRVGSARSHPVLRCRRAIHRAVRGPDRLGGEASDRRRDAPHPVRRLRRPEALPASGLRAGALGNPRRPARGDVRWPAPRRAGPRVRRRGFAPAADPPVC